MVLSRVGGLLALLKIGFFLRVAHRSKFESDINLEVRREDASRGSAVVLKDDNYSREETGVTKDNGLQNRSLLESSSRDTASKFMTELGG